MGSLLKSKSTRAQRGRSVKSVPKPRRKPARLKPSKLPASADALPLDDTTDAMDECLSGAWSVLDCAVTCLDVLAENSDLRPACQPGDVGVLVRRAVELIRKAKGVVDLGGAV